ncbi:HD domain-containing phosphohydrolase [Larsenimonas suaedae]|uniref:PilZ domain-containing protein n=1 Tax=Larsenimonas suaedae TaxID=1851019 RepID=A0ABU1GY43_9GAMM|nr:HD domain-containing phosphohydrolase [Larsenimonas suaedae]MCM2972875.1 PilZ domain-containing protein [Larsenimonas suaedae]MDR5896974.1 PilZ domain-containing protein [Larsenimonas suaedae]
MTPSTDQRSIDIVSPGRVADTLSGLTGKTYDITIELEGDAHRHPVDVVHIDTKRQVFALDISALGSAIKQLTEDNRRFSLIARRASETISIHDLKAGRVVTRGANIGVVCDMPAQLNIVRERSFFRAQLSAGMYVKVKIKTREDLPPLMAVLKNLSIGGCLIEMALKDAVLLKVGQSLPVVRAIFPNEEAFDAPCVVRHLRSDTENMTALVGLQYTASYQEFERNLWQYVREIEREAARRDLQDDETSSTLWPSPLFQTSNGEVQAVPELSPKKSTVTCATGMALKQVSDYLNIQMVDLSNGGAFNYEQLASCANTLVELLETDRQDVLYKVACIRGQSPLVMHSITVAVKLADLAMFGGLAKARAVEMAAGALIHDMGKAMLPHDVLMAKGKLTEAQRSELHRHVSLIEQRLIGNEEGPNGVYRDIVCRINERLDGNGYPAGVDAASLSDEARMAAVVDVIDAMTRNRADRPAWQVIDAYRYIFSQSEKFDNQWVNRYIKRFGFYPIGSLVRFSNGFLAWIMRHDDEGQPCQVKVAYNVRRKMRMDDIIKKADFPQLGDLSGAADPNSFALTPR